MTAFTESTVDGAMAPTRALHASPVTSGRALEIGKGFRARAFREKDFGGAMDPLVLVDHYRMTTPTFGAHPHAGLSAVSLLFEDSKGRFHNRDSLGNDFDLLPGDLYWLQAGSGVIHDESPRPGSHIHGLQVFVNLPSAARKSRPTSLHVGAAEIPVHRDAGCRVRVVLGESNGIAGRKSPGLPMTILDGHIDSNAAVSHLLKEQESAWIYAVAGELLLTIGGREIRLLPGQSVALAPDRTDALLWLKNPGEQLAHFALFAARPINEAFVQKGPFVMGSAADIAQVEADYASGKLGNLT